MQKKTAKDSKRLNVLIYKLLKQNGLTIQICRTVFLTSLGFKAFNTPVLRYALINRDSIMLQSPAEARVRKTSNFIPIGENSQTRSFLQSLHFPLSSKS